MGFGEVTRDLRLETGEGRGRPGKLGCRVLRPCTPEFWLYPSPRWFLRKNIILWRLWAHIVQECDFKGFIGGWSVQGTPACTLPKQADRRKYNHCKGFRAQRRESV